MRIAPKQTLTRIIPIILIPDWSQTNAPLESLDVFLTSEFRNKFGSSVLTIFVGKNAQLCPLVKSAIFIAGISNFGIAYFKRYILVIIM